MQNRTEKEYQEYLKSELYKKDIEEFNEYFLYMQNRARKLSKNFQHTNIVILERLASHLDVEQIKELQKVLNKLKKDNINF